MRSFFTMPIFFPTSSFKTTATVVISGVFSVAAAVSFTVPSVSHFVASWCPTIYDNTVSLLKPPFLYLVINSIIVSIIATSKLTHKSSSNIDYSDFPQVVTPVTVVPVPSDIDTSYLNAFASDYTGFVDNAAPVEDVPEVIADDKVTVDDVHDQQAETEEPKVNSDSSAISVVKLSRKSPRFRRQKSLKNTQQGNNKSALGVSKPPRRQDTLETTWKKITEGRSTPLTKHLTKSDKWKERSPSEEKETLRKKLLKREPSPGQEELNRRVEAFIKKFNEEMRLQRLESLAKYNQLVNGGTRL